MEAAWFLLQKAVNISDEVKKGQEEILNRPSRVQTLKKGDFLLHKHNKQAILEMFGTQLSASGISVMHSGGDADVDIVSSALTVANTCPVTFFVEDTNLLIILLWNFNPPLHHHVHLRSNSSKTAADIQKSKQLLGDELTHSNIAINSFCGCDITRHHTLCWIMYSITIIFGKSRIAKSIEDLFISIRQKKHIEAREKILLFLLGGKRGKILDEHRVHKYHEKMSDKRNIL